MLSGSEEVEYRIYSPGEHSQMASPEASGDNNDHDVEQAKVRHYHVFHRA